MDVTAELTRLSGLQQLQAIFAGKTGYAACSALLTDFRVSSDGSLVKS
jgi:hypothetical protein